MREIEWVLDSLTKPAGISPSELRQWFLLPIPAGMLQGKQAMKVQIANAGDQPAQLYGSYAVSGNAVLMPSVNLHSWEKAFYGVETDEGLSDSRYNMRLKSMAATCYDNDLSTEPGIQSGRYNIHLLAAPPEDSSKRPQIYVLAPERLSQDTELLNHPVTVSNLDMASSQWSLAPQALPAFQPADLWVVRVSGAVRRSEGEGKLGISIKVAGDNPAQTYISPWAAATRYGTEWRHFDTSVPVQPGSLPGKPDKLLLGLSTMPIHTIAHIGDAAKNDGAVDLAHSSVDAQDDGATHVVTQFKDVSLRIERLPSNPLWPRQANLVALHMVAIILVAISMVAAGESPLPVTETQHG